MSSECRIWVPVYVVMISTKNKHFQWVQLMEVRFNIETTNHTRNKNHLSRVNIFHPSIHLTPVANLFVCFQLDI